MNQVLNKQQQIIQKFKQFATWEDKYKYIIELGKSLPSMSESLKTEDSIVKGCQSQVWLHAKINDQGIVDFFGDSDALIVKGLLALLIQVYSGSQPEDILTAPIDFIKEIGFEGNLSPSRANGFMAMIRQMRLFATAFAYQKNIKK